MNMKFTPILVLSALVAAAPTAFAASTTDITVIGTITPAACTPSLGGGGDFDFGTISAQNLNQDVPTRFDSLARQMSVVCEAPTRFALHAVDGRAGTEHVPGNTSFGLGWNGSEKIGRYFISTTNYIADGNASTTLLDSRDGGGSWLQYGSTRAEIPNANEPWLVGVSADGASEPSAIERLTADLQIVMQIAPAKDLTLTDDVKIDGASTIEVVYL